MFNYSFKIFTRQNKTVTENNLANENSIIEQIQKKVAKIMKSYADRGGYPPKPKA